MHAAAVSGGEGAAEAEELTDAEPVEALSPDEPVLVADSCTPDSQEHTEQVQEPIPCEGTEDAPDHTAAAPQHDSREPAEKGRYSGRPLAVVGLCMAAIIITAVAVSLCLGLGPAYSLQGGTPFASQPRGNLVLPDNHVLSGADVGKPGARTAEHANEKALVRV